MTNSLPWEIPFIINISSHIIYVRALIIECLQYIIVNYIYCVPYDELLQCFFVNES